MVLEKYLWVILFCCVIGVFSDDEHDKLEYSDIGDWETECHTGRRMRIDQSGVNYARVRTTTRLKWGVRSHRIFTWGVTFDRSNFVRRNKRRKPNLLRIDLLNATDRTIIRWVNMQVRGAQKVVLKFSQDGRRWTHGASVSSENLMHRSEGPLFDFGTLKYRRCDWNKENCRGVRARHLKLYFYNPVTSIEVPSVINFEIGACFVGKGGPPPIECRQDSWGSEYAGRQNLTISGKPCLDWTHVLFRQKPYYEYFKVMFPEGPAANGEAQNYCRQVGHRARPGCHTSRDYRSWETCKVIRC